MRFSLFLHMERLGADADDRTLYREMLELCELADAGGFDALWVGEHHGMTFTMSPNPFLHLVDLARRTTRVRLGTATIVAPFWHPIKLAGEAAMADLLCDGRLELGLARGAYQFEYERLSPGLTAEEAGARLREMIPALKGLWRGDYAHAGAYWQFPVTTSAPKPLQAPHPKLWVAARDPASHQFAVDHGCHVQVTPLWHGDDEVETLIERFNDACAKTTFEHRPEIMLLRHTMAVEDASSKRGAVERLRRFYQYFGLWFQNKLPTHQGALSITETGAGEMDLGITPEMIERNLVIGTPDEVVLRLKRYRALGFAEFSYWMDSTAPFAEKKRSLELFIDDVIPAMRPAPDLQSTVHPDPRTNRSNAGEL